MEIHPNTDVTLEGLENSINRGIAYLHDHQLPNGEFLMYMSGDDAMSTWNLPESCVFTVTLIATCLLPFKGDNRANEILTNAAEFLIYQMDRGGTWNHYTILHRFRNLNPNDLDDTACASYFLEKMNYKIPSSINKQLMLDNRNKKGLFYTWLIFRFRFNKNRLYWRYAAREIKYLFRSLYFWHKYECTRYDIDAVVNANVLFYLGLRDETKPIIPYLIDIIKKNKEHESDKWYLNPFTVYYFISRNIYNGITEFKEIVPLIIERILATQNTNGKFANSELETALGISALINIGYKGSALKNAISHLLKTQEKFGNWKRWAYYYTGPTGSSLGSEELTTAFCLEALEKYKTILTDVKYN